AVTASSHQTRKVAASSQDSPGRERTGCALHFVPTTPREQQRRMRPQRVLTWHVHGSYLYYLAHSRQEFYLPVKPGRPEGYFGRTASYVWPDNVHEVSADEVRSLDLDCVLFQSRQNYLSDQYDILSAAQRRLPRIYLEHDPPREHPTDTHHPCHDADALL